MIEAMMMPEIVVTAPRPNRIPVVSAWTGDAPALGDPAAPHFCYGPECFQN